MNEINIERPTMAIPTKGLSQPSLAWLEAYGVELPYDNELFDRLGFVELEDESFDLLRARPKEVPDRVATGDSVMGIACTDGLVESGLDSELTVVRNLGFGVCRMSLLVPEAGVVEDPSQLDGLVVATSYPTATKRYFDGIDIEPRQIKVVGGSTEGMPRAPVTRADAVVDLVESGNSVRANKLREIANLGIQQAILIENPELASCYMGEFNRFVKLKLETKAPETVRLATPLGVAKLDKKLANYEQLPETSGSRRLLRKGVEAINRKLGEESAETLQAFFVEEDGALLNEAQSVVWLMALGLRARGLDLGSVVAKTKSEPVIQQKGDKRNDAVRSYGDAQGAFAGAVLRGDARSLQEAAGMFLGTMDNLLALRSLNMAQVYERL